MASAVTDPRALFRLACITLNERMIDKLRIARDLEGSVQDLIEGLSPSSPGRTEGKPQKV